MLLNSLIPDFLHLQTVLIVCMFIVRWSCRKSWTNDRELNPRTRIIRNLCLISSSSRCWVMLWWYWSNPAGAGKWSSKLHRVGIIRGCCWIISELLWRSNHSPKNGFRAKEAPGAWIQARAETKTFVRIIFYTLCNLLSWSNIPSFHTSSFPD